jgi:hypothetical protein
MFLTQAAPFQDGFRVSELALGNSPVETVGDNVSMKNISKYHFMLLLYSKEAESSEANTGPSISSPNFQPLYLV